MTKVLISSGCGFINGSCDLTLWSIGLLFAESVQWNLASALDVTVPKTLLLRIGSRCRLPTTRFG